MRLPELTLSGTPGDGIGPPTPGGSRLGSKDGVGADGAGIGVGFFFCTSDAAGRGRGAGGVVGPAPGGSIGLGLLVGALFVLISDAPGFVFDGGAGGVVDGFVEST